MELKYLYDDVSPADIGGGFLYDNVDVDAKGPEQLFDDDYVVVIPRKVEHGAHGAKYVQAGEPVKVVCSIEGRAQQAGMFSISGVEDKNPSGQQGGGVQEVSPLQIIAREWPGDIYSRIWYRGDYYDADGSPVYRRSGSGLSNHVEVRCRRVVLGAVVDGGIPEPEWTNVVGGR